MHVVYRFDTGGLENGVVNLINRMQGFRHTVVALTEAVPQFCERIGRDDVSFHSLHKGQGHGVALYPPMAGLIRQLRPDVVHTRNLAALEMQVPAWWCGARARVHSEHGRDVADLDGSSRRMRWARRLYAPFVHHYIALSRDLETYLVRDVGIAARRITQVYNGVDSDRFHPRAGGVREAVSGSPFNDPALFVAGFVGRMQAVKDPVPLARAFVRALELRPQLRDRLRLAMIGEGPLRAEVQAVLDRAGVAPLAWLPGERRDVAEVMRGFDAFVLSSKAEGISNTILEAMATGLPVIATDVGGNADLLGQGAAGTVLPPGDPEAMAIELVDLVADPARAAALGRDGRAEVERRFSMETMVAAYGGVYEQLLRSGRYEPR